MSIESRLESLESSARRWRVVAFCLACSLLTAIGIGAGPAVLDVIRAKEFQVIDSKGRVAIRITTLRDQPSITDAAGKVLLSAPAEDDGRPAGKPVKLLKIKDADQMTAGVIGMTLKEFETAIGQTCSLESSRGAESTYTCGLYAGSRDGRALYTTFRVHIVAQKIRSFERAD